MTAPAIPLKMQTDCWNRIGVWGDRTCPELPPAVHCRNCPVFAEASRRFLDTPSPDTYLAEWTARLADPIEEATTDAQSVLIFRLGEEWLALRVQVLVEVTNPRPIHRIPHRAGLLAGLVNIRGELHLCVHLAQLLGIPLQDAGASNNGAAPGPSAGARLMVVRGEGDPWVFPVDEVAQVYRFSAATLTDAPATLSRSAGRLTLGVFGWRDRSIGYLDDAKLFQTLKARIR